MLILGENNYKQILNIVHIKLNATWNKIRQWLFMSNLRNSTYSLTLINRLLPSPRLKTKNR